MAREVIEIPGNWPKLEIKGANPNDIPIRQLPLEKGLGKYFTLMCCICRIGVSVGRADIDNDHIKPQAFARNRANQTGWLLGKNRQRDICPLCVIKMKGYGLTTTQMRRMPRRLELEGKLRRLSSKLTVACEDIKAGVSSASPEEPTVSPVEEPAMPTVPPASTPQASRAKAEPPREPTRAEMRTIHDQLGALYDEDGGRYKRAGSDQALADTLKMPRAWVARVRDQFFGPDRNEANDENLKALELAKAAVIKVEADIETALQQIETAKRSIDDIERRIRR